MAACRRCGVALPGRQQKCDACKAAGKAAPAPAPPADQVDDAPPARTTPEGLHSRGRALWTTLKVERGTALGELALEVCRSADRLDELDRIIAGKGVLNLLRFRMNLPYWDEQGEEHVHIAVGFQSVLSEARGQQATFAKMLADLTAALDDAPGAGGAATGAKPAPVSPLDQLAAMRAQRREQASS